MSGKLDEYTDRANQAEQQIELLIKVGFSREGGELGC